MFNLTFKQQVLTGFTISLIFVLISAVSSYQSIKSLDNDAKWQTHTYDVITHAQKIEMYVINAETGLRGYVLTQLPNYLDPYTSNVASIIPSINELRQMVGDNPEQLDKIDSIAFYAAQKMTSMNATLVAFNTGGQKAGIERVLTGAGKTSKDKMLAFNKALVKEEFKLLEQRKVETVKATRRTIWVVIVSSLTIFGLILFLFTYIKRTFDEQKKTEDKIRDANSELEKLSIENQQKNWLLTGAAEITDAMRGEQELKQLATNIVAKICRFLDAPVGVLFFYSPFKDVFKVKGGYALDSSSLQKTYTPGEGLVGQVAVDRKSRLVNDVPADYLKVKSGLGERDVNHLYLMPVIFEEQTLAVIEIGFLKEPDQASLLFLKTISESIGVAINSGIARVKLRDLVEQTQQQAEELEAQQEELRVTNDELVAKTDLLVASEEELKVQQEELMQANVELEEKAQQLEEQNLSINQARDAMILKAEELEISSKYKSEFLANMSHELRTPLNSILILARILKENKLQNLNEDQIKYAGVIHTAGNDLLTLINDILDLSKIESGKIDLTIEPVYLEAVKEDISALFSEVAKSKRIDFNVNLSSDLPETIVSDNLRLAQILKNLLSNAFKFTPEKGNITLEMKLAGRNTLFHSKQLADYSKDIIAFSIKDSGIGIAPEKQKVIFEAFQQADGSTSRKYGGTGLGLSISKELAHILGGEINIESAQGVGSTFTLFLPADSLTEAAIPVQEVAKIPEVKEMMVPSRPQRSVQTLLIIEDDKLFAEVLMDYAKEKGFEPMVAYSGDTGLEMAIANLPDAIVLDVMLPVMDGWNVLKQLKSNPATANIPVHLMSAGDANNDLARHEGAIGFLKKPVDTDELDNVFQLFNDQQLKSNLNRVLVVEDQQVQSELLTDQLRSKNVEVSQAFTGKEALELLAQNNYDCIILDLNLPDTSGLSLLDKIKAEARLAHIPVIINTAMELDQQTMAHIMSHTEAMVLKSNKSNDRLIDEVSLFMNKLKRDKANPLSASTQKKAVKTSTIEKVLKDKTILITDDDMRNIFALSSALQDLDVKIVIANNGREALQKLDESAIDLVLMDIMMPEMDGYEAMKAIRSEKRFAKLPIIALTAKAMKNDREKCIEAGANEYISKPVDIDKLLSLMRVWLS